MRALAGVAAICSLLWVGCAPYPQHLSPHAPRVQTRSASAKAWFERGMLLAARGDSSRAEQYLMLALRQGYSEERAIVPLLQVCVASSRLRAALEHGESFSRRHPASWQLRYLLAAIRFALGDAPAAVKELARLIAQRPEAVPARYLLAVVERDAFGDEAAARHDFEAYVERDPLGTHALEARAWLAEHPMPSTASADAPREATP